MDQELTKEIGQQIDSFYESFTATLVDPASSANNSKTDNVKTYLSFVNAALEKL